MPTLAPLVARLASVFAFIALLAGLCPSALSASDASLTPTGFPHENAASRAASENKHLLLVFTAKWEPDCVKLQEDCLAPGKVQKLLAAHAVVRQLDVLDTPELTSKHHVRNVPMMILLKPDGTEADRWLGFVSASRFATELSRSIAGHPTIERLRSDVKPSKPETSRDLATTLFNRGSYADALAELKSLYERLELGTTKSQLRTHRREHRRVISLLAAIRQAHTPAREFLLTKRDAHAAAAAPPANETKYASRVAAIDRALGQPAETLKYFRSLPADSPARRTLRGDAFLLLTKNREYTEAAVLYQPAELEKQFEQYAKMPWSIVHGIIRVRFPIKGGDLIKTLHTGATYRFTQNFETFSAVRNKEVARMLASSTIKHDRSDQAIPLLTRAACRALGNDAPAFLQSLEIPNLPPKGNAILPQIEPSDADPAEDDDADDPVIKLSPFVISTRTFGVVPMELSLPGMFGQKKIPSHLPVRALANYNVESLSPYQAGAWLVAINGKSIKGRDWEWLTKLWLEGGETGMPVTLVLKGTGADDCVYREITVKRVRPAASSPK